MSDDRPLSTYRSMRRFDRTPEPAGTGDEENPPPPEPRRFVVQEHHATALHWDFRLERDGVLVSWAVPKGIPPDPRVNHLAVHTEDHPMEYLDFAGEIPEGEYGGGTVRIWDRGTYDCEKWSDREVMVVLHGEQARGRYVLFRTRGRDWMMHRMDPPEDPARQLLPDDVRPAAPVPGRLPRDQSQWSFEVAWGGERVAVASAGGRLTIRDADGREVTACFPELSRLGRAIGATEVVLEGELVVLGADGRPDGERMARRLALRSDSARRRAGQQHPATLLVADLLWLDGHPATTLPYTERRRLLDGLALAGPTWTTVPSHAGDGAALRDVARQQGLPGVLARRLNGPYEAPRLVAA